MDMPKKEIQKSMIWMDGKIIPLSEAAIPMLTHSFHYGTAAFEGQRFYMTDKGRAIFRLKEHTERFFHSIETLGMKIPFSKDEIMKMVDEKL